MGGGFSAALEPLKSVAKSVGDGLKGIKLPDNPLNGVSLGNKGRKFLNGVRSGLMGNKQVRMSSVSSTPPTAFGFLGKAAGHEI